MQMNTFIKFLCMHLATCLLVLPPIFTALTYSSEYINRKEKQDTPLPKDNQKKDSPTEQLKLTIPKQVVHNRLKNRLHSLNIYILMGETIVIQSCPSL